MIEMKLLDFREKRLNKIVKLLNSRKSSKKVRMRTERFKRELQTQVIMKKELFETARNDELRRFQIEKEREDERQRVLNEERRKLVVGHILSLGPKAVKYLPKGVLKLEDLDYLPEEYRFTILSHGDLE